MEVEARMWCEPGADLRVLVGGVVVHDEMQDRMSRADGRQPHLSYFQRGGAPIPPAAAVSHACPGCRSSQW